MKCPICGSKSLKTTNTRPTHYYTQTWRRKMCNKCQSIITTYEKADMNWINIKEDTMSKMSSYKKAILYKSILGSFSEQELANLELENIIDSIEQKIVSMQKSVVTKKELIKIVLNTLKPISLRAYIDYLSKHTIIHNKRELDKILKQT